ncbi:MAG: hypothetical protein ACD_60C00118G0012 [uncultured bacterium]|nr:MAG: hypothetical protein ACD_60C00118G0012 [uncultured bacterium]
MTKKEIFRELLSDQDLTITPLRKDVPDIFLSSEKPLSAYEDEKRNQCI